MAKDISRKVTIYINYKEVDNTLKSIRAELARLRNAYTKASIGSEERSSCAMNRHAPSKA